MSWKKYRLCLLMVLLMLFALGCPAYAAVDEWTDLGIYGGGGAIMVQDVAMQTIGGTPYAAYTDDLNNVVVKKYDAGSWTTVVAFTDGNGAANGVIGIALGSSGSTLYLAYTSGSGYIQVKSLDTSTPGAEWTPLSDGEFPNAYYIDMVVDGSTLYMGIRGMAATVAIYNGSSWSTTTLAANSQNGAVPVTVLDGTPYAVYYDNIAHATYLTKYEGGSWSSVAVTLRIGFALDMVSLDGKLAYLYNYYDYDTASYFTQADLIDPANSYSVSPMTGANGSLYDGSIWDADLLVANGIVYGCYIPSTDGSTPDDKIRLKRYTGSEWEQVGPEMANPAFFVSSVVSEGNFYVAFSNYASFPDNEYMAAMAQVITPASLSSAPVVTQEPTDQTVDEDHLVTFSAAASGAPAPTMEWLISTDNGISWDLIPGATETTYSFTAVITDNGNQYKALFTNTLGEATTTAAVLTVNSIYIAPVITQDPQDLTVTQDQPAQFTAAASGTPTPAVQWEISTDNGYSWSEISGATATTYSFTAVITDDGNLYQAVFSNIRGYDISTPATLTVNPIGAAPLITLDPVDLAVTEGQTAEFTAAASGTPEPSVQWEISTDSGVTWSPISGATATTLSFTAILSDNGSLYRAVFTNATGTATSAAAALTVNARTHYQVSVSANNSAWGTAFGAGEYATGENVAVSAVANLGFSFVSWQENGTVVSTSATYRFKMGTADRTLTAIFQPSWPDGVRLSGTALSTYSVRLSLNRAVQNADSYVIHYDGSDLIPRPAAGGTTWIIEGLSKATTYTFTVQAIYNGWPETTNGPSIRLKTKNK